MIMLISFSSTASRVNKLSTHAASTLTLPVFRRHLKHHFALDAYSGFTKPTIKIETPAVSCGPSNAFEPSIYDYLTLAFLPGSCYTLAHAQMLLYSLTKSSHQVPLTNEITPACRWSVYLYKI